MTIDGRSGYLRNPVWYFAYGSNLNVGQMRRRVGQWQSCEKASLRGWRLVFNVPSDRWGGLAANIVQTGRDQDRVWGVLYRISQTQLDVLTTFEGVLPVSITVEMDGQEVPAKVYLFQSKEAPGRPPSQYLDTILGGLRQHGYDQAAISSVAEAAGRQLATGTLDVRDTTE